MKIERSKRYRVVKSTTEDFTDLGVLPGSDVKRLLKGYILDERYDMFFSEKGFTGYVIEEVA